MTAKAGSEHLTTEDVSRFNALLDSVGDAAPVVKDLLLLAIGSVVEARYIFARDKWSEHSADDSFLLRYLRTVQPDVEDWDNARLFGQPALPIVRSLNQSTHSGARSPGGSQHRERVEAAQGKVYCVLCGREDGLHVDHIQAVALDGGIDDIHNLQLLCGECNIGKGKLAEKGFGGLLENVGNREISLRSRYVRLAIGADDDEDRIGGRCCCGTSAKKSEIEVVVCDPRVAANFVNLTLVCDLCRE